MFKFLNLSLSFYGNSPGKNEWFPKQINGKEELQKSYEESENLGVVQKSVTKIYRGGVWNLVRVETKLSFEQELYKISSY